MARDIRSDRYCREAAYLSSALQPTARTLAAAELGRYLLLGAQPFDRLAATGGDMRGTVTKYSAPFGRGEIQGEDKLSYTFRRDALQGISSVAVGDTVEFEPNGAQARNVKLVSTQSATVAAPIRNQAGSITAPAPAAAPRFSVCGHTEKPLPYGFVPIKPEAAVLGAPIFHDGGNPDQAQLLSGELRCTLRALTPLLVGNDQYCAEQVQGHTTTNAGIRPPDDWGIPYPVNAKKTIVEPLRWKDGCILIGSSALTGMIRHSLGALLSAPMERVAERSYSYRPNLGHAMHPRYESRPAVVVDIKGTNIELKVLLHPRAAIFVRGRWDNASK